MANYYNLTGWKRTGFDVNNRPYNREVLEQDYFRQSGNYFTMQGIVVKRDDMRGVTWIELPGSVKDIIGQQENAPSQTGPFGPGGPFYSWEEVDYIRLVRNGYPGDVDYVDISGNVDDPWAAPHEGKKLFVGYYFVTGMTPTARSTTIVYLLMDEWLSMGGADELEIESGFKTRGHITESEDAAHFNMVPEPIGISEPLVTISNAYVNNEGNGESYDVAVSAIDLAQYDDTDTIEGFVAQATTGQSIVFPAISAVSQNTIVQSVVPTVSGDVTRRVIIPDYGFFDVSNNIIKHNMSILYSAGQIELQDSYSVPRQYGLMVSDGRGAFTGIQNKVFHHAAPVSPDIGEYPRKADYLYGQVALYSLSTGSVNIQPFSEIEDYGVDVWALLTPSGSPVARFRKIKGRTYEYDCAVPGIPWVKKAIVMQGASGSMWNQISYALNKSEIERQNGAIARSRKFQDRMLNLDQSKIDAREFTDVLSTGAAALGKAAAGDTAGIASMFPTAVNTDLSRMFAQKELDIRRQAITNARDSENQGFRNRYRDNAVSFSQAEMSSPYVNFVPDLNAAMFQPNGFGVQVVNTTSKDRKRLKDYFKRYGYSGLYKPLTFSEINIKKRVNYIECSGALLRHEYYPMRVTMGAAEILNRGIFLWNEKPNQAAFDDNPDN